MLCLSDKMSFFDKHHNFPFDLLPPLCDLNSLIRGSQFAFITINLSIYIAFSHRMRLFFLREKNVYFYENGLNAAAILACVRLFVEMIVKENIILQFKQN